MDQTGNLAKPLFDQQQKANHLDAATGRTGATTNKAGEEQNDGNEARPDRVVSCGETCRCADRHRLKDPLRQGFIPGCIGPGGVERQTHHNRHYQQNHDVELKLRILQIDRQTAASERHEMEREIDPGDQQKHNRNHLDQRTVEIPHAGIMGGKTTNCDCRKRVTDGIEKAHARSPVGQRAGNGQPQINVPERLGRFGNTRRQFGILHRPRRFRAIELHTTDTQHWQYRNSQHDDSHATQPLQLLPIKENRWRQSIQTDNHCRARCRQTGNRLEYRIGYRDMRILREDEG